MRHVTIYSVAAVCGLGAFVYTLSARASRYREMTYSGGVRSYATTGHRPNDILSLEMIVHDHPERGGAWYKLAELYHYDGREEAAQQAWGNAAPIRLRFARANPGDPDAWYEAGYAYAHSGQSEAARPPLMQADDLLSTMLHDTSNQSRFSSMNREAWYRLGWARKLLGNEEEARMAWSRAVDLLPAKDSPSIDRGDLYDMACYLALMGERYEALDVFERSVAAGFDKADHAEHDEDLDTIRDDPRFRAAVARMREANTGMHIERGP